MEEQKVNISNGLSFGNQAGEYRYVQGEEPVNRVSLMIDGLTPNGLIEFIRCRIDEIKKAEGETHVRYSAEDNYITLIINDHGGYRNINENYIPPSLIKATESESDDMETIRSVMSGNYDSPHRLFLELRQLGHLFHSRDEHREVLQTLRSATISVKNIMEDTSIDSETRKKRMESAFVEAPPQVRWNWFVPIFNGHKPVTIAAEVLWELEGSKFNLKVVNWDLNGIVRDNLILAYERSVIKLKDALADTTVPVLEMN